MAARQGFSLAELLIVLVVIGIISVLVIPRIEIVKFKMDGSARGVVSALVVSQRVAVKRQHNVVVAFDTVNHRLRIHEDANNNGLIDAGERVRYVVFQDGVRLGRGPAPPRPSSVTGTGAVSFTETQDGMPAVRFVRGGSGSEQGWIYLTSTRSALAERFAKDSRLIEVDRATGRASWYYYDSWAWKQGF